MSLKYFHIFFIILSTLLAFGFGIWGINSYAESDNSTHLGLGIVSLVIGVGLIFYAKKVYQKLKKM